MDWEWAETHDVRAVLGALAGAVLLGPWSPLGWILLVKETVHPASPDVG